MSHMTCTCRSWCLWKRNMWENAIELYIRMSKSSPSPSLPLAWNTRFEEDVHKACPGIREGRMHTSTHLIQHILEVRVTAMKHANWLRLWCCGTGGRTTCARSQQCRLQLTKGSMVWNPQRMWCWQDLCWLISEPTVQGSRKLDELVVHGHCLVTEHDCGVRSQLL